MSNDEGEKKYLVDGIDHGVNNYMEILERHVPIFFCSIQSLQTSW
jgi:hypothetical protein